MLAAYSLYVIGLIVAITIAFILHKREKNKDEDTLLIELPEYKTPNARTVTIYVWDKVKEETAEVEAEMRSGDKANLEAEFGDLFFALVNAARLYGVDPESALERTNKKFIRRFNYMEEQAAAQGNSLHDLSLGEMEALWQEAKKGE